jgi:hypothetical protein
MAFREWGRLHYSITFIGSGVAIKWGQSIHANFSGTRFQFIVDVDHGSTERLSRVDISEEFMSANFTVHTQRPD